MCANLVRASRLGDRLYERVWAKAFEDATFGDRRLAGAWLAGAWFASTFASA
jgi:hypothetical protein